MIYKRPESGRALEREEKYLAWTGARAPQTRLQFVLYNLLETKHQVKAKRQTVDDLVAKFFSGLESIQQSIFPTYETS